MRIRVSIIICTKDRADNLRKTLMSVSGCIVPGDLPTELVVVDNGSADDTRSVVELATLSNVLVRYVHEPRVGKAYAYNTGLASSRGDLLLFTDDDVRVPTHWIVGMCRPLVRREADGVAGGVTLADYLTKQNPIQPAWLASTSHYDPVNPGCMVGANMAIGRWVLERVPAFDVELGPGALGFGEETLFAWQMVEAGYKIAGAMDIAVEHFCDAGRAKNSSMVDTARKMGQVGAYIAYHWKHEPCRLGLFEALKAYANLFLRRTRRRFGLADVNWCQYWELERVTKISFYWQYRREACRRRQYSLRGLVKNGGESTKQYLRNVADPIKGSAVTQITLKGVPSQLPKNV